MVSVRDNEMRYIQGGEFFANTYKLALKNGFPFTDLEMGCYDNQYVIKKCRRTDLEELCCHSLEASFQGSNLELHDLSLFVIYNSMLLGELTLIRMRDIIEKGKSNVESKKHYYYKAMNRCINSELKEIEKQKKYQKQQKIY